MFRQKSREIRVSESEKESESGGRGGSQERLK